MDIVSAKERWSSLQKMTARGQFKNGPMQGAEMDSESDLRDWRTRQLDNWTKRGILSLRGNLKCTLTDLLNDDNTTGVLPGQISSHGIRSKRPSLHWQHEPSIKEGDEQKRTIPLGVFSIQAEAKSAASPPNNSSESARSSSRDTVWHDDKNSCGDDIPVDLICNKHEGSCKASTMSWTSKACKSQPLVAVMQGNTSNQDDTQSAPLPIVDIAGRLGSLWSRTTSNHSAASSMRLATGIKKSVTRQLIEMIFV